jgi:hypothetical protein
MWKLRLEQRQIAAVERQYESDGRLTPAEKRALNQMQNRASRNIAAEAHDNEHRWWKPWQRYSYNNYAPNQAAPWWRRPWWAR